jgi:CubicO group peptidase (beta-lactamase class C family)
MPTFARRIPPASTRRLAVLAAIVLIAFTVLGPRGGQRPTGIPATDSQLDAWLAHQIADAGIPGGAVVVVRDGRIEHMRGFGIAADDGRPVEATTPFVIGSLSKSMTALAVVQLVEAGRVELDRPVLDYVPELDGAADPAIGAITVRQLLDQTSGFSTAAGTAPLATPATTLAARVRDLASVRLASAPGAAYQYSNANYLALGRLVEAVSGHPFGAYLAAHVFEPLGMTGATTDHAVAAAHGLSRAHRLFFGLADSHEAPDRPDLAPAGFIAASAEDLGRWLIAQLGGAPGGVHVVSPTSLAAMHDGVAPTGIDGQRYGLGWVDGALGGVRVVSHAGSTTDMAAFAAIAPERGLGIAILLNGQSPFYELLHKPEAIGLGVLALSLGQEPGGTLEAFYPILDVTLVVLLVLQLRGLARLARRQPTPPLGWRAHPLTRLGSVGLRVYLDVVVPLAILVLVPGWLGPWPAVLRVDLGVVLAAVVALRLTDGAIRVWQLRRRSPRVASRQGVARRRDDAAVGLR